MLDKPTDAMIEAGQRVLDAAAYTETSSAEDLAAAYLAMKALDATLVPDSVQSDGEGLGEALFALSDRLRKIGALESDNVHAAYERVVAEFTRLTSLSAPVEKLRPTQAERDAFAATKDPRIQDEICGGEWDDAVLKQRRQTL